VSPDTMNDVVKEARDAASAAGHKWGPRQGLHVSGFAANRRDALRAWA
jgi:hypothetical protein